MKAASSGKCVELEHKGIDTHLWNGTMAVCLFKLRHCKPWTFMAVQSYWCMYEWCMCSFVYLYNINVHDGELCCMQSKGIGKLSNEHVPCPSEALQLATSCGWLTGCGCQLKTTATVERINFGHNFGRLLVACYQKWILFNTACAYAYDMHIIEANWYHERQLLLRCDNCHMWWRIWRIRSLFVCFFFFFVHFLWDTWVSPHVSPQQTKIMEMF